MPSDDTDDEGDEDRREAVRDRLDVSSDGAVEELDEGLVDLLAWVLDTETRARIYIHLREHAASTSEEIAEGTGLYPSTVREALAELHAEGKVTRQKRQSSGAGNNPYEYRAIPPSELAVGIVEQVQDELNTVFNLDDRLADRDSDAEPITISVRESDPTPADDD